MCSTAAEVQAIVEAPVEKAFEHIVPIDLTSIFTGYGPLPAVVGTRNQTGGWNAASQTRTVLLSDGSSAQEALTEYEYPTRFGYTVKGFTGVLRFLAREAHGEWWFERVSGREATTIRWRYEFVGQTPLMKPLLCFITRLWRGYMHKALKLSMAQVEARED